jgi:hypothetical protein
LSDHSNVVAIVKDPALLRSIGFALNTHGQVIEAFSDWPTAAAALKHADCVIIDACLPQSTVRDAFKLTQHGVKLVILAEDDTDYGAEAGVLVLSKPLTGSDIANAVEALRRHP